MNADRRIHDHDVPETPAERYHVLVVCTGNICRSPMGEIVLRDRLERAGLGERVVVTSAGVSDEEEGNGIDPRARRALVGAGYDVHEHVAHQVRAGELGDVDLVLAMTAAHETALQRLLGRRADEGPGSRPELRMWREFDPEVGGDAAASGPRSDLDAPDPWYGGEQDFDDTLGTVERASGPLVDHVRRALRD